MVSLKIPAYFKGNALGRADIWLVILTVHQACAAVGAAVPKFAGTGTIDWPMTKAIMVIDGFPTSATSMSQPGNIGFLFRAPRLPCPFAVIPGLFRARDAGS